MLRPKSVIKSMQYTGKEQPYKFMQRSDKLVDYFNSFCSLQQKNTPIFFFALYIAVKSRSNKFINKLTNGSDVFKTKNLFGIRIGEMKRKRI